MTSRSRGRPAASEVRVVTGAELGEGIASGGMARHEAVSNHSVGSEGIFMGLSRVPPGATSSAHVHTNCESALYVAAGRGHIQAGPHLEQRLQVTAGDFIYVPPGAPHLVANDGPTDLTFVVARNTQEEVVADYRPG